MMEQILLAYGLLKKKKKKKKTVITMMILNINIKAMFLLLNGDTDFFNIITQVLQGDKLVQFLFIISLDYVLQMFDERKRSHTKQRQETKNISQTITNADYTDHLAFLANTFTQPEFAT